MNLLNEKISVIVPVYKVEIYLNQCIESIVNQTYQNLEIILIDDGSPDRCPEICDRWAEKDNRIRVIHKKNGGLSDARNAGIEIATGDYIAFVDSDDWIASNMYEIMLKEMKKVSADICACNIMFAYTDRVKAMKILPIVGDSKQILDLLYSDTLYPVATWNKLYCKKCWETLRFPQGKICEDAFTTYLLVHSADRIIQIDKPLYYYRIRENSIMTSEFSHNRMDEEEAWRKNYEFIVENYPALKQKAYDFYLQRVNLLIHAISEKDRCRYQKDYAYLYDILKSNFFYIMFLSKMNLKYRVKFFIEFIRM